MTGPLTRDEHGDWVWTSDELPIEGTFGSPGEAVEAGIEAIRAAVEAGELTAEAAVELSMDARFALGAEEHHLGGADSDAFQRLSDFEDELA